MSKWKWSATDFNEPQEYAENRDKRRALDLLEQVVKDARAWDRENLIWTSLELSEALLDELRVEEKITEVKLTTYKGNSIESAEAEAQTLVSAVNQLLADVARLEGK
jgi:hypothetical protein